MKPNRTMLPPDEGYLQAALVRLGRAISVACFAGTRNPAGACRNRDQLDRLKRIMLQTGSCRGLQKLKIHPKQSRSGTDLYRPSGTGTSMIAPDRVVRPWQP